MKRSFTKILLCAITTISFLIPSLSATEFKFQDYPGTLDIKSRAMLDMDYLNVDYEEKAPGKKVSVARESFESNGVLEVTMFAERDIDNDWRASWDTEMEFKTDNTIDVVKSLIKLSKGEFYAELGKEDLEDAYIFGEDTLVVHAFYGPKGYGASDAASYGFSLGYESGDTNFQFWVPYTIEGSQNVLGARPFLATKFGAINFVGALETQTKRDQIDKETKTEGQKIEAPVEVHKMSGFGLSLYVDPKIPVIGETGSMIGISYASKKETTDIQYSKEEDLSSVTYGVFATFYVNAKRWFGVAYHHADDTIESESGSSKMETDESGSKWFASFHQTIGRGAALKLAVSGTSTEVRPDKVTAANPDRNTEMIGTRMRLVYRF
ncbi:MAG: hypothetical protein HQM14_02615 [SAR324 cluster bacterium]|nr:hypothetical protein [SAR324 cluster bacterium]